MTVMSSVAAAPRSWVTLKEAFVAAEALERQFDAMFVDPVVVTTGRGPERSAQCAAVPRWVWKTSERLTDVRCDAEEALIFYPAPDLSAALWKIEYGRDRWKDSEGWPDAWWSAIIADLRRLASVSEVAVPRVPDAAALMAEVDAIDGVMANRDRSDGDVSASVYAAYALYERIEALPNTGAYLAVRARAIGSVVDNTGDVAKLDLGELSAHAESNAGELIRQVLACILDGGPKSEDTPARNIEVAA